MKKLLQSNTSIAIDTHGHAGIFSASAYYKYLVNISSHKFTKITYNPKFIWHTKMLKKISLVFAIFCVTFTDLKADFKLFPIMQEFEYIISYDDAVRQFFYKQSHEILEMEVTSHQAKKTYTVIASKNKWFVKITREDCYLCHDTSFDYEWQLKYDEEKINLIKTINAELILPDKRATFMLENKKHLIASYPWAPGKTLKDIYTDHFLGNKTSETLKMSMYRYGQVLAIAALDQNDPNDDIIELLNRTPQILLDDRTGQNTKYFERNDKIYLLDLSIIHPDNMASDTVEKSIIATSINICQLLVDFLENHQENHIEDKEYIEIFLYGREYLSITLSQFIAGYISALPNYDPNVIQKMLLKGVNAALKSYCDNGMRLHCNLINNEELVKSMQ